MYTNCHQVGKFNTHKQKGQS